MTNIGIIRCEKNEKKCPLTGCIKSHDQTINGFGDYDECSLTGVLTCRCPGTDFSDMVKVLKAKGADRVHIVTCAFAKKVNGEWVQGGGFCSNIDNLAVAASAEAGVEIVKGTAHLPAGYIPEIFS